MLVRLRNDEANFRNLINKPCIIRKLYDTSERSTCLCFSRLTIPAEDTGASKTSVVGQVKMIGWARSWRSDWATRDDKRTGRRSYRWWRTSRWKSSMQSAASCPRADRLNCRSATLSPSCPRKPLCSTHLARLVPVGARPVRQLGLI